MFGIIQLKSYVRNHPGCCSIAMGKHGSNSSGVLRDILFVTLSLAVAVLSIGRTKPTNSLCNPFLKIIFIMTVILPQYPHICISLLRAAYKLVQTEITHSQIQKGVVTKMSV